MHVTETIWLDDNEFIVNGKKMTTSEISEMQTIPESVCMSPNNKKLIDKISAERKKQTATVLDALKVILKK